MSQSACANLNSLSVLIISSLSFLEINYFNGYVSIIVIFIIIINLFQFGSKNNINAQKKTKIHRKI